MKKNIFVSLAFLACLFFSCGTRKDFIYFQHPEDAFGNVAIVDSSRYELRIMPNDNLLIVVSAENPLSVEPYNRIHIDRINSNTSTMEYNGYLVDGNGEINFSGIGKIKIGGMTKFEAERLIGEKILKTVENPVVDIRLVNYKITVMGEVASPNIYRVSNEKISIVQAIAMAGDLTLYGQRRNIQVFRVENGEKKTYTVDITSPNIFYSPAYYLQQNDIVYVSPNGTRTRSSTTLSPYISLFITSVSFIFSALAFLVYQRK